MSESIIDFAGLDTAAAATTPTVDTSTTTETPVTETTTPETTTEVETPAADGSEIEAGKETSTHHADGREKNEQERTAYADKQDGITERTPAELRSALKALRDLDPKYASAVRSLHGAFERFNALKETLGSNPVATAKDAMEFVREITGAEAGSKVTVAQAREAAIALHEADRRARESDQQLYAADPKLMEAVVSDLKEQGKLETALPKLASQVLQHLQKESPSGFTKAILPVMVSQLREAGFTGAVNELYRLATASGDKAIIGKVKALGSWFNELQDGIQTQEQEDEHQAEQGWRAEKAAAETKAAQEVHNGIARTAEKFNNTELGKHLGTFIRMPFFKGMSRENLMPLGNTIKANLYATLKADKNYQDSMRAMMAAKTPDKAKIQELHEATVAQMAEKIVRETVQKLYPMYNRGGAAAQRIAGKAANAAAVGTSGAGIVTQKMLDTPGFKIQSLTPTRVAVKPKDLDYSFKGADLHIINGRGFVPVGKGSWRFVSWR